MGGRTPDRAGITRWAGKPELRLFDMMFRLSTDQSHTTSGHLWASFRPALGWDVPRSFVFCWRWDVPCTFVSCGIQIVLKHNQQQQEHPKIFSAVTEMFFSKITVNNVAETKCKQKTEESICRHVCC